MQRSWRTFLTLITFVVVLTGCSAVTTTSTGNNGTPAPGGSSTGTPIPGGGKPCTGNCAPGSGVQNVTLYTEPDAGKAPILDAINGAQRSVWVEMYLLTVRDIINALENDAQKGIEVKVMLEGHPYGGSTVSPQQTIANLQAAGAQAKETNPAFQLTHAKLMVVDGTTTYISTANYTLSALGGSSSTTNREFIVKDNETADVQECIAIFDADWNRTTPTLSDANLVVSPVDARSKIIALIQSAKQSLDLEEEEMQDPQFIQALIAAEKNGVKVTVIVPQPKSGSSDAQGESQMSSGGVKVDQLPNDHNHLYIHAKDIIVDGSIAYVGSVNASTASMDDNREVGVIVANSQAIQNLMSAFQQDAS